MPYRPVPWEKAFLCALRRVPSVTKAAEAAGVAYTTVMDRQRLNAEFKRRYEAARQQGIDRIEQRALEAALEADDPDLTHQRWMLSRLKRDVYGREDRLQVDVSVSGKESLAAKLAELEANELSE